MNSQVLPDVLQPDLRVVFCGTAAGTESAARGAYYAGKGNKFWKTLYDTRLTPYQLQPEQFQSLRDYRIGLTDVCKTASGMDHEVPAGAFSPEQLRDTIAQCAPLAVAFNGKRAAQIALGIKNGKTLEYGPAPVSLAGAQTWVLPSTSGAAAGNWDEKPWHALARSLPSLDHSPPARKRGARCALERRQAGVVGAILVLTGLSVKLHASRDRSHSSDERAEQPTPTS